MKSNSYKILLVFTILVVGLYFFVNGIIEASGFLKPLVLAGLLAMVLIPLSQKLESWGFNRVLSSLYSVLVAMMALLLILGLLVVQINKMSNDWPDIKENLKPQVDRFTNFVENTLGLTEKELQSMLEENMPFSVGDQDGAGQTENSEGDSKKSSIPGISSKAVGTAGSALLNIVSFMGTFFLVFIYIFFILFYRRKIKLSVLKFFDEEKRDETKKVLKQSVKLSGQYLIGRLILIFFLSIIYSVGLTSFGIQNAIFIGVFSAILSIIPYIGNIIGMVLAVIMATVSGGELWMYLGVAITFTIAQFVESYILQPYVVGDKVDLNPIVTILVVVIGGAVWGIMGMIISIPVFGICKIIFDHIPATKPLGYALGSEDIGSDDPNFFEKLFRKIKN
jgi:predicted PurR-regulated permease PerM